MRRVCSGRQTKQVWVHRWMLATLALLVALIVPVVTLAHPLGNFTVNHYSRLELSPGNVRVFYVLDMAEIPTFQTIQQIDRNGDKQVSADEGTAYATTKMDELRQNLQLALNNAPVALKPAGAPDLSFPPGQGGLSLLRLTFWLEGALPMTSSGSVTAEYSDNNNVERIGWREIVVRGQNGLTVFNSTVSDQDRSNELRVYPTDMLSSPLRETSASFSFQPNAGQAGSVQGAQVRPLGAAANDGAFAALITVPDLDTRVILLALATALGLGALHALEPGHGKTAAAAYLIGARATPRHALVLGLTITAMHTSSVFILGLVTLFASRFILPERLLPWLGLASGLIVVVIGLRMFLSRLGQSRAPHSHDHHGHDHGDDHHDHHHEHDHGHDHHLPPVLTDSRVGWRGVLAIGVSGGLLPCPAALVVLLSAIGLGRIGFGMLLIVAFSGGLALVLSGIGLTILYGGRWLSRHRPETQLSRLPGATWAIRALPAFSALLVVGAGVLLLYNALPLLRIWQM